MSLTVIAGEFGRRRLECPPGKGVRPIMARVKGAVFNSLFDRVVGTRVLDIFAGSGSFGIEALSRGALSVDFVEQEPLHAEFLQRNLDSLGVGVDRARVHVKANRAAFQDLEYVRKSFDLILADPPFSKDFKILPPEVFADLEALAASPIWVPGGTLVLEHRGGRPPFPRAMLPWRTSQRDYGDATVSFFSRSSPR